MQRFSCSQGGNVILQGDHRQARAEVLLAPDISSRSTTNRCTPRSSECVRIDAIERGHPLPSRKFHQLVQGNTCIDYTLPQCNNVFGKISITDGEVASPGDFRLNRSAQSSEPWSTQRKCAEHSASRNAQIWHRPVKPPGMHGVLLLTCQLIAPSPGVSSFGGRPTFRGVVFNDRQIASVTAV